MKSSDLIVFALPVLLLVFLFTSQRRRQKAFEQAQAGLTTGRDVVTTSGLHGRIIDLDDTTATLEIAPGVRVRWDRRAIVGSAPGGAPGATTPTDAHADGDPADPSDPTQRPEAGR